MHFLVTGHTGFKGGWLTALLHGLGHEVSGISLDPSPDALFLRAGIADMLSEDVRADIRDWHAVQSAFSGCAPDVVIHMAAQPLVRMSYLDPRTTLETNVNGTFNILDAIAEDGRVKAALVVTTDKVYYNLGQTEGYVENDPLGGRDLYSASKAMADILTTSWTSSFDSCSIGIARAGNVIGGGDVSIDRLFPDIVRAFAQGSAAQIRAPASVRPWQHVLDCLQGYLMLIDHLLATHVKGDAWNFGPKPGEFKTVEEATSAAAEYWGPEASWGAVADSGPHEEVMLTLDSNKARTELGWRDHLSFDEAVEWTIRWAKDVHEGKDPRDVTMQQIMDFAERASGV